MDAAKLRVFAENARNNLTVEQEAKNLVSALLVECEKRARKGSFDLQIQQEFKEFGVYDIDIPNFPTIDEIRTFMGEVFRVAKANLVLKGFGVILNFKSDYTDEVYSYKFDCQITW